MLFAALVFAVVPARAQSAETPFHVAANQFISGDHAAALASVNEGLRRFPGDARLVRLKEEIEKKQEQQRQQNQQNQQNQQDQQNQQGGQQQDQNQQDSQDQQGGNRPPEQQDPGEQPRDDQQDDASQRDPQHPGDEGDQEPGEQQRDARPDPSRLSRAEAERILQALGNEEETLLRRVARPQTRPRRVEKDW